MADAIDVIDDAEHSRFLYVEDGQEAQLAYRAEDGRLVLTHTEVPDAFGGRGIAGRFMAAAVARAADRGETLAPWCPYTRRWLERHPDEAAAVDIDWREPDDEEVSP